MTLILTRSYEPGFPACWEGLCLASAIDCTPRMYGVSIGNGNDGVSHTYANYYVRTCDPWSLAYAATLSEFSQGVGWDFALSEVFIDGDRDFCIRACILNPPDDAADSADHDPAECDDEDCEECATINEGNDMSWSDANGAWFLLDVFPESDPRDGVMVYDSLSEAYSAELLVRARHA